MMRASLVITTYNWPEALARVLQSACGQGCRAFEIVVADDGSDEETAKAVREVLDGAPVPWRHVRQEDQGIRQARIKNLGVRFARGDYLIFVDHDVLLHPNFISDHLALAAVGRFLQGKRAFLSRSVTREFLAGRGRFPPGPFSAGMENRKNALRIPGLGRRIGRARRFQTSLRGCNLSMHRRDFLAVDGYDETFDGLWGREDSDICYRLFHRGIRCRNLWFSGLQYHLFHPTVKNRTRDRLDEELDRSRQEHRVRARIGYSRLSGEGGVAAESSCR